MSNRLTFEFAVKVGKSTIRELQASRRELLVQSPRIEIGGSDGTRTRDLLRDGQAF